MITTAYYQDREARLVPPAARWLLFPAERSSGVSDPACVNFCAPGSPVHVAADCLRGSLVLYYPGSSRRDLCWRRGTQCEAETVAADRSWRMSDGRASSSTFIPLNGVHSSGAAALCSREQRDTLNVRSGSPVLQDCARH